MKKIVIIAGPTASGKSDAAILLSKLIGGEVISADSMQVYKGMDIGTAKVTKEEMQGIPHHLIDVLSPFEEFNVSVFKKLADEAIEDITLRGHIPVIAGGTGFYIQAVLYGIDFDDEASDPEYRSLLEEKALKENGPEELYEKLKELDPASCEKIHKNNIKRVIRALEYIHATGEQISVHNRNEREKPPVYDAAGFFISDSRDALYERIDRRVDVMIERGLVAEVKSLLDMGVPVSSTAMQGLGYKEIAAYLNGTTDLDEAVNRIKTGSRHFAKRQFTWFNNREDFYKIERDRYKEPGREIPEEMYRYLKDTGFIRKGESDNEMS